MSTKLDAYHAAKRRLAEFDKWRKAYAADPTRAEVAASVSIVSYDYGSQRKSSPDNGFLYLMQHDAKAALPDQMERFRTTLIAHVRAAKVEALSELADLIKEELPS